jgi:hypothetical protein
MNVHTRKGGSALGVVAAGLLAAAAVCMPAMAQETEDQDTSTAVEEDTSWKDKSVRQLRREYRDAEEAFYEAFNEVNSDDEFDMDCKTAPVLGSRKRERKCQAEFLWDYEEELGEEMYRRSSTGSVGNATTSTATLQRKQEALRAELSAAVSDYPEVAAAFAELRRTKRNYELKMAEE